MIDVMLIFLDRVMLLQVGIHRTEYSEYSSTILCLIMVQSTCMHVHACMHVESHHIVPNCLVNIPYYSSPVLLSCQHAETQKDH